MQETPFVVVPADDPSVVLNRLETPEFQEVLEYLKKWKQDGILEADMLALSDNEGERGLELMLAERKPCETNVPIWSVSASYIQSLATAHPEWTYGFFLYLSANQNFYRNETAVGSALYVSSRTKYPETAVRLLEKIHTDQRYYDLFLYGVDGIHYHNIDGAVSYEGISTANKYGMTVANDSLLGRRYLEADDRWEEVREQIDVWREEAAARAKRNPLDDYEFAAGGLERELHRLETVRLQDFQPLVCGYYDGPKDLEDAVGKLEEAGLVNYMEEIERQLTVYYGSRENDVMFCGAWHGLNTFAQQGNFADLSAYFNNDDFPGLKAAFSENFVDAMTSYIRQEDGSYKKGIYGINLASFYEDSRGFMYREDLRQKYNCDPITDRDSLFAYMETVTANEPDMIGASVWNLFYMDTPVYSGKHDGVYSQDSTNIFGDQTRVFVGLSEDGKTVLNAVVPGDAQEEWDKMPEGYQYDFITEYAVKRTEWNPYLNPNRGGTDTVEKEAAIAYCPLSEFESKVKEAQERIPGSEYGYYVYEDAQRSKEKGAVICDMVTNNWLVVPEWSDKVDAVMYFLDWMFGTQETHDLFQYGIEGEDWESVGEEGYKQLDISEDLKYTMPNYSFTLNPTYIRYSEFVLDNAELKADFDYIYDKATYRLSPLAGFSFDAANVETEVANISALSNELQLNISLYEADEAEEKLATWHADATDVGLETVRQELITQLQAFLDAKNAQ